MKTKILILKALMLGSIIINAQSKFEKIIYTTSASDGKEMNVFVKDAVSTKGFTKFNLKITNKGSDILVYKAEESVLKTNNKEIKPFEKRLDINPSETDNRVVNFNGNDYLIPAYSFVVNGVYKVSTTDKANETENYQLPPSHNEFKSGNFSCTMVDLDKETDKTSVKFECTYNGDKFGVINPSRTAIKLPDGTEIANAKSKQSPIVLAKGESEKFTLVWNRMEGGKATDMQKINLLILWRNTFVESAATKLEPVTIDFKIDESKSK